MNTRIQILHISTHLGGGVGRVLLEYLASEKKHKHFVYCLDYINDEAKNKLVSLHVEYEELLRKNHNKLLSKIKKTDIVIMHWWNHPLFYEFIIKNILPPCKIAIWSHTSGFYPPQIFTEKLLDYPDIFVFTTPMSYLSKEVKNFKFQKKLHHIWSSGGLEYIKNLKQKSHKNINIGYIGSIDFAKMSPDFIEICSKIDIENVNFIVCGDGCDLENLKNQAKEKNIEHKIIFTGFTNDIKKYLSIIDIFGYALNKNHYGTCDQVIAEAMGSGIPVVALNNKMEKYMIHDMHNGIIASNQKEYIKAIKLLIKNQKLRKVMAKNAKNDALAKFNIKNTINEWDKVYKFLLEKQKTKKTWSKNNKLLKPNEIFMQSIGKYAKIFQENDDTKITKLAKKSTTWKTKSNGSVHQYYHFFQDDKILKKWSILMS